MTLTLIRGSAFLVAADADSDLTLTSLYYMLKR